MFFKNILKWFNNGIKGNHGYKVAHHPYFGDIGYYDFKDDRVGYWECELEVGESVVSVIINSETEALPTNSHQDFVESIINELDSIIVKIKPLMLKTLFEWKKVENSVNWYRLFRLSGIEVPIDADERNDWEISFECLVDKAGHHFTCYFKNGKPKFVSVDG